MYRGDQSVGRGGAAPPRTHGHAPPEREGTLRINGQVGGIVSAQSLLSFSIPQSDDNRVSNLDGGTSAL